MSVDIKALKRQWEEYDAAIAEVERLGNELGPGSQDERLSAAVERRIEFGSAFGDELVMWWPAILAALERIPELEQALREAEHLWSKLDRRLARAERVEAAARAAAEGGWIFPGRDTLRVALAAPPAEEPPPIGPLPDGTQTAPRSEESDA